MPAMTAGADRPQPLLPDELQFVEQMVGAIAANGDASDVASIVRRVLDEFDVDPATARGDVEAFLGSLHQRGVLEE